MGSLSITPLAPFCSSLPTFSVPLPVFCLCSFIFAGLGVQCCFVATWFEASKAMGVCCVDKRGFVFFGARVTPPVSRATARIATALAFDTPVIAHSQCRRTACPVMAVQRLDSSGEPAAFDTSPGAGSLHRLAGSLPLAPSISMPRGLWMQRGCRDRTAR